MADHSLPTVSSTYANFVSQMSARFNDLAVGLDPAVTTATNVPTNAIRWSSAVNRFQKWNGTAWVDLSTAWSFPGGVTIASPASGVALTVNSSGGTVNLRLTRDVNNILDIYHGGGVQYIDASAASSQLALATVGVTRIQIGASGNVTINTPGSGAALTVYGVTAFVGESTSTVLLATGQLGAHQTSRGVLQHYVAGNVTQIRSYGATAGSGQLAFQVGGGGGSTDFEAARFDAAGNFGIGTAAPGYKLHIKGGLAYIENTLGYGATFFNSSAYGMYITFADQGSSSAIGTSNGNLIFYNATNTTERARIDSSGNLGLGVTPSAWSVIKAIEIGGFRNAFYSDNGSTLIGFSSGSYYNAGWKYAITGAATGRYEISSNSHAWYTAPSGTAGNAITFTQAMTLDASGNLLVGGTTQYGSAKITLTGVGGYLALNTTTAGYTLVRGFDNGTERWSIGQIGFGGADGLAIYTGTANTERVRVTPAGVVFTTAAATTPVAVTFSATAMTVDCSKSNVFTTTFTANVTTAPTISNPVDGQTINWFITQDATGSRTMTWPTTFKWPGGSAGVLSTTANAVDLLVATYRSATTAWYATLTKAFA